MGRRRAASQASQGGKQIESEKRLHDPRSVSCLANAFVAEAGFSKGSRGASVRSIRSPPSSQVCRCHTLGMDTPIGRGINWITNESHIATSTRRGYSDVKGNLVGSQRSCRNA